MKAYEATIHQMLDERRVRRSYDDLQARNSHRTSDPLAVLAFDVGGGDEGSPEENARGAAVAAIRDELRHTDHLGAFGQRGFVAVLPEVDITETRRIGQRIIARVRALVIAFDGSGECSVAVGWASASEEHDTLSTLIRVADERLRTCGGSGHAECERSSFESAAYDQTREGALDAR